MNSADLSGGVNHVDVQKLFCPRALLPSKKNNSPFFPINLCLVLKALCPFQPFSNCLCCVSPTLRCPLISSLRQDLSFSPLLTSFFFLMQPHPTRFSPFLLFPPSCPPSFFTCCFFPSLHFLCDSQRIKRERSAVSFFFSFGARRIKLGRCAANA